MRQIGEVLTELPDVKFDCHKLVSFPVLGRARLEWAGHTQFWTLETGAKVWLRTNAILVTYPPKDIDLPILLGDGTVIMTMVVSSSRRQIVIELDSGHRRRLTPGTSGFSPRGFPGSEWIVQLRL